MASCRWCCAAQVADGLTHNPLQNDLPGPGNYHRATSFIRTADSVSKLGYGVGFVSKVRSAACGARLAARRLTATPSALPQSKRFAAQDRSHMQSTLDPGPGAYNADPLRLRKANFSRAKTTGVFAKPRRVRRPPATCRDRCALALPPSPSCMSQYRDDAHIDMQPTPGPGDYNPTLRKVATAPPMFKPQGRQSSTFESKTKRDSYIARASVAPAPGHYKYDTSSFARARRRGRGGAVFRSTEPKLSKLYPATSRGIPGPGAYMKGAGMSATFSALAILPGVSRVHHTAPSDRLPKQTGVKEAHKPSSMFSNQQCDRFGIPFERKTVDDDVPGPGAYAPTIKTVPRVSASSHVFLSNVNRLGTKSKAVKPPGPGSSGLETRAVCWQLTLPMRVVQLSTSPLPSLRSPSC